MTPESLGGTDARGTAGPSSQPRSDTRPDSSPNRPLPGSPARRRRRRTRRLAAGLVLVLVAAAGLVVWRSTRTAPPVRYVTAEVTKGTVAKTVTASGAVNPVITVQVGSYVSGVIQQVLCDYNTTVKKGQLCAKIDPRPYQIVVDQDRANLSMSKAQLAKDQTNLTYAKVSYDRAVALGKRGIDTQDAVDAALSAYNQAKAQVDVDQATIQQHEAALKASEINMGYTDIVSPVDGTVVSRNITVGQTVAASFQTPTLFLIATDLTTMQVDANVSESDIGTIANGSRAYFTVEAFPDRRFDGTVTQVRQAPQMTQNVVTYDVVVSVRNPEFLLKPGMTATVKIVGAERDNVLRVPEQALRFTPGGVPATAAAPSAVPVGTSGRADRPNRAHVWVLRAGKPVRVPVTVGLDDETFAEIQKGDLQVGDRVIVSEQAAASGGTGGPAGGPRGLRF